MIKSISTLIKLYKQNLDEKRRQLNNLLVQKDKLELMLENSIKELIREREFAEKSIESRIVFARFVELSLERQRLIRAHIWKVGEDIEVKREEIAIAYADLKKYEIIREVKITEEEREAEKREQLVLDEIGITAYIRRDKKEDTDVAY